VSDDKQIRFEPTVWYCRDSYGNEACGVVDETSDLTQCCGMMDRSGSRQYFESEFYHMGDWAREHGIDMWSRNVPLEIRPSQMHKHT
jgi:hypothetical protein